jgi:hypothetical protein
MTPSFAYVYEAFTQDPKFERDLAKIETEIARLGIQGRTIRLALFRDIADGLQECLAAGVKNVIFIGDDNLVFQAIPFLVEKGLVGGFIPLRPSLLASVLAFLAGDRIDQWVAGSSLCMEWSSRARAHMTRSYFISPPFGGTVSRRETGVNA